MTNETRTLAGYRLDRAREALEEAGLLFSKGHTNAYVSRLYYFVDAVSKEAENRMKPKD